VHLAPLQTSEPDSRATAPGAAEDRAAFAELYEENFGGLFDFVVRIVRNRDVAADVVQATFARAWDEIRLHRELRHPKAWLYGAARNRAIDELRGRRWIAEEPPEYAQADSSRLADPQAVAEDQEMVDLVWSSAAALSPGDYSLLDLHVRRGFGAAELAETLELERGAVYTRLSRLRSSLEESVAATLLVRRGRDDCEHLAAIAGVAVGDSLTPELRRAVRAHVKDCETCSRARRRFVSPVELFGALAPVAALPGVRESIWQALPAVAPAGAASGAAAGAKAAGVARRAVTRGHWAAGTAVVVAAAAVVAIVASAGPSVGDPQRVAGSGQAAGAQPASRPHATGGASRSAKGTRRGGQAPKRAQSRPFAAPDSRTGRSQARRESQSRPHHGRRHGPSGSTGSGPTGHVPAQPTQPESPPAHAPSGQAPAAPGAAAPPPTGDPAAAGPPATADPSPVVDPPAVVDDDHANYHHHHHGDPD
jgi:RNA polymerase sigma factor (sigma-70 family)